MIPSLTCRPGRSLASCANHADSLSPPHRRSQLRHCFASSCQPLRRSIASRESLHLCWAAPEGEPAGAEPSPASPPASWPDAPETVFYEGSGSNAELGISLVLGATLVYLPLTLAAIGRRLWISYKFTDRRLIVTTNSPVLQREVQIEYSKIKEIRSVPRMGGLWGDCVFFLKDGSRLELVALENFREIQDYIEVRMG